jgi:hypothetical protein
MRLPRGSRFGADCLAYPGVRGLVRVSWANPKHLKVAIVEDFGQGLAAEGSARSDRPPWPVTGADP